jgi:hypothetical protein
MKLGGNWAARRVQDVTMDLRGHRQEAVKKPDNKAAGADTGRQGMARPSRSPCRRWTSRSAQAKASPNTPTWEEAGMKLSRS